MLTVSTDLYGLAAMFETPEALRAAAQQAYQAGYRRMDAYSPIPIEGLAQALGHKSTKLPLIVLLGGIAGGAGGYFMQWYSMAIDYPLNIGGRPFHSWPMFIPITFELTVLSGALCGVFGMLFLNGLPRLHHPIFKAPEIERATLDRFFLCIEASDPRWSCESARWFLESLHPARIIEVKK
jgi:hypothetical protein